MISYCRDFLKTKLTALHITPVYTRREDADAYKGLLFSMIEPGTEKMTKTKERVASEESTVSIPQEEGDPLVVPVRIIRNRIYSSVLPVFVTIVAKNLPAAEEFRQGFLKALGDRFLDPDQNAIMIEATECVTLEEKGGIQNPREGFMFTVVFTGGIYKDDTINRLTGQIVPEIEIVNEEE